MPTIRDVPVAILGLGTVGSGVYRLLNERREQIAAQVGARPLVKRILVRHREKPRLGVDPSLLTDRFEDIASDPEIQVVVEVMGGRDPALRFAQDILQRGKHLVMANKELIATHGPSLFKAAARHRSHLLFEAAVAGGIPIVRAMQESLTGDRILRIQGIINGTTNYIITRMTEEGLPFLRALHEAQAHGYAEADPSSDVDAVDPACKLAILASLAFKAPICLKNVTHAGIRDLHPQDIEYARELGYTIKLLAEACDRDGHIELSVGPALVPHSHPLASVREAFNAILVQAEWAGELMFYGQGAGMRPTASAVVADVVKVLRDIATGNHVPLLPLAEGNPPPLRRVDDCRSRFYLRLRVADEPGVLAAVALIFARESISMQCVIQKGRGGQGRVGMASSDEPVDVVFLTHETLEKNMTRAVRKFRLLPSVRDVAALWRVKGAP